MCPKVTVSKLSVLRGTIDPTSSSSASRFTAGPRGFFDLIQCGERPER
jgi:hypothetical protein